MRTIAICDDNRLHGAQTENVILRRAEALQAEPRRFETPDALLRAIAEEGYRPRVAILDIRMDGMDGITLARQINHLAPQCAIIFLTAFLEYATDVYESQHVYFILKEELEQRIDAALEKALAPREDDMLVLPSAGHRQIPCRDILYLERILRKTKIQCQSYSEVVSATPNSLLERMAGQAFIRCHQSYWVNFYHIRKLEKNEFVLSDGSRIPVSRTFRGTARTQFFTRMEANAPAEALTAAR